GAGWRAFPCCHPAGSLVLKMRGLSLWPWRGRRRMCYRLALDWTLRMTFTALVFLALAMSTDAFAAAIAKGAALRNPGLPQALRIGLLFGCIETITPLVGWALGSLAADAIRQWDHWIAFFLLLGLGGRM